MTGARTTPTAVIAVVMFGPSVAVMPIASTIAGNDMSASTTRTVTRSNQSAEPPSCDAER